MSHVWRIKDDKGRYLAGKSRWSADYDGGAAVATSFPVMEGNRTVALVVGTGVADAELDKRGSLIAAAPDLLEALQDLLRVCNEELDDSRVPEMAAARRAIRKARGES